MKWGAIWLGGAWLGAQKSRLHEHLEFKDFILGYPRSCVVISSLSKAVRGGVEMGAQMVLLCFSCNWALLPSV